MPFISTLPPATKFGFPTISKYPSIFVSAVPSAALALIIACFLSEHLAVIFKISPFSTFSFRAVALSVFFFLWLLWIYFYQARKFYAKDSQA